MAVRRALGFIQVGGVADGAADAAPSPSALRAEGAEAKRTPKQINKRKPNESTAVAEPSPLNRSGIGCRFSRRARLSFIGFYRSCVVPLQDGALCNFREQRYHSGAYLPDIFALYPTPEAVEKQDFSIFQSVGADDIFVHDVGHKVLIQSARVNQLSAGFLYVLHEILYRLRHFRDMVNGTERIAPELLGKKRILLYRLHSPFAGIEVVQYLHFARKSAFRDIEQTVKVKPVGFPAAFPCADIQPPLAA